MVRLLGESVPPWSVPRPPASTGELRRTTQSAGLREPPAATSKIPRASGDRVKTDRALRRLLSERSGGLDHDDHEYQS